MATKGACHKGSREPWAKRMMAVFIGIVLWAWSGKRREDFEAAARVPLDDDEPVAAVSTRRHQAGH